MFLFISLSCFTVFVGFVERNFWDCTVVAGGTAVVGRKAVPGSQPSVSRQPSAVSRQFLSALFPGSSTSI
jgi:hypothetical protein